MAETQVKNTFIDVPSTATPMPSPPATAPARQAVALKESLQQAAEEPPAVATPIASPVPTPAVPAALPVPAAAAPAASTQPGVVRRAKPNPLNFLSQNSMVSIPEDQANGQAVVADPMKFVSGVSELPSTPAYTWGVLQTPTGTPSGYRAYQAPMIPAVATPTEVQRKTLSLQEMIQSPKVEDKNALLNNSYHQLWNVQQYPPQALHPGPALHPLPHGAPMGPMPVQMAPDTPPHSYPVQAPVPHEMYMPMQAPHHPPIFSSVPVHHMAHPPPVPMGQPPNGAAVTLGLVPGAQPMPQLQPMPHPMPHGMPMPMPQPMPQLPMPQAHPPLQPMQPLPMQPAAQPLQAQFGLPSYAAPHAAPGPGVLMTHPGPPPPPTFAAPAVVMSPKGSTQPAMSESDIRTLLEAATASGNPEAINAVARQAQMAGMPPEKFRSLLPAPPNA